MKNPFQVAIVAFLASSAAEHASADWKDDLRALLPDPAAVHVVVELPDKRISAFGMDEATGAWYRYMPGGEVRGWLPKVGSFQGLASVGHLHQQPNPSSSDYMIERRWLPHVYLRQIVTLAEPIETPLTPAGGGWVIKFDAPFGDPRLKGDSGLPIFQMAVRVSAEGRISELERRDRDDVERIVYFDGSTLGIKIGGAASGSRVISFESVSAADSSHFGFDLASIESRVEAIRVSESTSFRAGSGNESGSPLKPGEASVGIGVKSAPGGSSGRNLMLAGLVAVVLGVSAWWKNRK